MLTRLRASLRRRPPTVVWLFLGLVAIQLLVGLIRQDDGLYGVVVLVVALSAYALLFFLRFRAIWVITAFLSGADVLLIIPSFFGEASRRGRANDVIDFAVDLASLILLLTPDMRAYFFRRERAPKVPPRPDLASKEAEGRWRRILGSIPTPFNWRNWPPKERLDLVKTQGQQTLVYPAPEAKQFSGVAIGWVVLIFAAQALLVREVILRVIALLGLIVVPLVWLRTRKRWQGPMWLLDDIGLKNLFGTSDVYLVFWREITGLRIKRRGGVRYLLIEVLDPAEVVHRQPTKTARWMIRMNRVFGLTVVTVPAVPLPITLERLASMILERVDRDR